MKIITAIFSPFARGGAFALLAIAILSTHLNAKERTNWIFGFGIGAGLSQIEEKYPDSAITNIHNWNLFSKPVARPAVKDWGVTWEFLVGYKHWLNNWVGFRYYANVGAQHYKDDIFTAGKVKAGIIEYTANADILLNFYNSEFFTFGILGGFGIGGASFDSPALDSYERRWGPTADNPTNFADRESYGDMYKTKRHHLSASLSVGTRFNIFQKIRKVADRTCDTNADGRRTCKVPISYLEHSIELNAKFPMLTYYPTKPGDLMGVKCANNGNGNDYTCSYPRPGYEVKNPYKLTLRYIVAF